MKQKRLLLVRHGETSANLDKVWHGSTDTPLTEQGEQQAQHLAQQFSQYMQKPDLIITSPLQRARTTAEAIATQHGMPVELNSGLQEYCIGDWEGYSYDALSNTHDFFKLMNQDENYCTPKGESRKQVTTRVLNSIIYAWEHEQKHVVVVAHGLAFALALAALFGSESQNWLDYAMDNTAVSEVNLDSGVLLHFNQTLHLASFESPLSTYKETIAP